MEFNSRGKVEQDNSGQKTKKYHQLPYRAKSMVHRSTEISKIFSGIPKTKTIFIATLDIICRFHEVNICMDSTKNKGG